MAMSAQVRASKFGRIVARALADAKARGLTIPDIEKATGVSKTTFYRWRDGDWTKDPRASQVKAFCEGLGIPVEVAHRVLGWSEIGVPTEQESLELEPDMRTVARRLRDPNVSEAEKQEIRTMLRYLARRPDERGVG